MINETYLVLLESVVELFPVLLRVVKVNLAQGLDTISEPHGWASACNIDIHCMSIMF